MPELLGVSTRLSAQPAVACYPDSLINFLIWSIAVASIAGVLFRPRQRPEAVWACLGASLLVAFRLIDPSTAAHAIAKGADVYLFLTGMMLLADLARREGVFDWLASLAVHSARGSRARLFLLVYGVGILVTVLLSNDATAVVLTPAVYAAVKRANAEARPYLFACAFVANAASFVLPISNPANLVVYGKSLPPLLPWLRVFALPSLFSIAVTFVALRFVFRQSLGSKIHREAAALTLSSSGRRASLGIVFTGAVLLTASAFGLDLGLPTCLAAIRRRYRGHPLQRRAILRDRPRGLVERAAARRRALRIGRRAEPRRSHPGSHRGPSPSGIPAAVGRDPVGFIRHCGALQRAEQPALRLVGGQRAADRSRRCAPA